MRVLVSSKGLLRAEKRKPGRIMRRYARKVSGSPFSLFHTTPLSEVPTCSRLLSPRNLEAACNGTTRCRPCGSCHSFLHWLMRLRFRLSSARDQRLGGFDGVKSCGGVVTAWGAPRRPPHLEEACTGTTGGRLSEFLPEFLAMAACAL